MKFEPVDMTFDFESMNFDFSPVELNFDLLSCRYEQILLEQDPVPLYGLKLLLALMEQSVAFIRSV